MSQRASTLQHELLCFTAYADGASSSFLSKLLPLDCLDTAAMRPREDNLPNGYKHPQQLPALVDIMTSAGAVTLQGLAADASAHDSCPCLFRFLKTSAGCC